MINQVNLIGNLGHAPEMRFTSENSSLATATLATTEHFKDKGGNKKTETTWHNLVFRGKNAENITSYAGKGRQLFVTGRISYRKYTDKNGDEKTITEIEVREFRLLGGAAASNASTDTAAKTTTTASPQAQDKPAPNGGQERHSFDIDSSDVPF